MESKPEVSTARIIPPTVGRVLWLWNAPGVTLSDVQPFDAHIVFVWNDRLINVGYHDHTGDTFKLSCVELRQEPLAEGRPDCHDKCTPPYAVWMPYQVGQAKAK